MYMAMLYGYIYSKIYEVLVIVMYRKVLKYWDT